MRINDLVPRWNSFVPGFLGRNVYSSVSNDLDAAKRSLHAPLSRVPDMSDEEREARIRDFAKSQGKLNGVGIELMRDLPAVIFGIGGVVPGLAFYAFVTYVADRTYALD